ncbi:MAG: hypothetical protein SFU25_00870 [Candidatus Caenarcaniphilales bacterium]|nr:hypothetical protein [Candidatus Caenarcaniphilales bacterium]
MSTGCSSELCESEDPGASFLKGGKETIANLTSFQNKLEIYKL